MTIREQIIEALTEGDATCRDIEVRYKIPHQSMGRPLIDLQVEGLIQVVGKRTVRGRDGTLRKVDVFSLRTGNCTNLACKHPLKDHVLVRARQLCAKCDCEKPTIAGVA